MCRFIAISGKKPLNPWKIISYLRWKSLFHRHGWGIASHTPGKSVFRIYKETKIALMSKAFREKSIDSTFNGNIVFAHVRKKTQGKSDILNNHPFKKTIDNKDIIFMHWGNVKGFKKLSLKEFKPIGTTDSEWIFCHLLSNIKGSNLKTNFNELHDMCLIISKMGEFSCALSDGDNIFTFSRGNLRYHEEEDHIIIKSKDVLVPSRTPKKEFNQSSLLIKEGKIINSSIQK